MECPEYVRYFASEVLSLEVSIRTESGSVASEKSTLLSVLSERNVAILYLSMAVIYFRPRASVLNPRHHAASFDLLHPRHVTRWC